MRKRNSRNTDVQEFKPFSFISLFRPTIDMAADLMNVSIDVVKEWLHRENLSSSQEDDILTEEAIDFLAEKYVGRLHKYFDNCIAYEDSLGSREQSLFDEFKAKYGKFYRRYIDKWDDIDTKKIAKDFKQELNNKTYDAFFGEFDISNLTDQVILAQELSNHIYEDGGIHQGERVFLYEISRSIYYGSRLKSKAPKDPEYRNIVLEILQENRFHIFSEESDSNALIDAILSSYVKQPQLAIASVFGYRRHKNVGHHDNNHQSKTYPRN